MLASAQRRRGAGRSSRRAAGRRAFGSAATAAPAVSNTSIAPCIHKKRIIANPPENGPQPNARVSSSLRENTTSRVAWFRRRRRLASLPPSFPAVRVPLLPRNLSRVPRLHKLTMSESWLTHPPGSPELLPDPPRSNVVRRICSCACSLLRRLFRCLLLPTAQVFAACRHPEPHSAFGDKVMASSIRLRCPGCKARIKAPFQSVGQNVHLSGLRTATAHSDGTAGRLRPPVLGCGPNRAAAPA